MQYVLIIIYLLSIILANFFVYLFGQGAVIINSFLFIGLDLTTRDLLHNIWKNNLRVKMLFLIFSGSLFSYILNNQVYNIALASFVAFFISGIVDFVIYNIFLKYGKNKAINISNVFSSFSDSLLFPLIAFGFPISFAIFIGQFLAKIFGGYFWLIIYNKIKNV